MQKLEPLAYLSENVLNSLIFRELFYFFVLVYQPSQVSSVHEVHDKDIGSELLLEIDDIDAVHHERLLLVVDLLQYFDLILEFLLNFLDIFLSFHHDLSS
jgi:hypothetical protein